MGFLIIDLGKIISFDSIREVIWVFIFYDLLFLFCFKFLLSYSSGGLFDFDVDRFIFII